MRQASGKEHEHHTLAHCDRVVDPSLVGGGGELHCQKNDLPRHRGGNIDGEPLAGVALGYVLLLDVQHRVLVGVRRVSRATHIRSETGTLYVWKAVARGRYGAGG